MYQSIVRATMIFHFLLCRRVSSSQDSSLKYRMLLNDDTDDDLSRYFNHFKTAYLEKHVPRHITIVGGSAEDMRQVEPLFKSYPYIICKEPKTCGYKKRFSPGSFVLIFLDDLREETLKKNVNIVSLCGVCKIFYLSRGIAQKDRIRSLFTLTVLQNGAKPRFAHIEKNVIKMYTIYFSHNCSIEVRSIVAWKSGAPFNDIDTWAPGLRDSNGCEITVSTANFHPKMFIEEDKNGLVTIKNGVEGKLLLTLAKKLNFTIVVRRAIALNQSTNSRRAIIADDVSTGRSDIGIGRLRPTKELYDKVSFSIEYDHDCVSWAVSPDIIWENNVIWVEFSWYVWALVGLIVASISMFGYTYQKIVPSKKDNRRDVGLVPIIFEAVGIHLGNSIANVPVSTSGKLILGIYLCYGIVITTAYKASLASILTTIKGASPVVDVEGIIKANYSIAGGNYSLGVLKDQIDESEPTSKVIERFALVNKISEAKRRWKSDKHFAYITQRSVLFYERRQAVENREPMPFTIIQDCVLAHYVVVIFGKGSPFLDSINNIIRRLIESGIRDVWDFDECSSERIISSTYVKGYMDSNIRDKFHTIFYFYCTCILLCLLVFAIELVVSRYN